MTWSERRIVTILSTILLILMAALLVVLGMRYRASRDIGKEAPAPGDTGVVTDQNAYTSLQYDNGSTTLSFTRDENGTWTWDGSRDFPLDDTVITSILELLTNWKPQQILTGAEAVEEKRSFRAGGLPDCRHRLRRRYHRAVRQHYHRRRQLLRPSQWR